MGAQDETQTTPPSVSDVVVMAPHSPATNRKLHAGPKLRFMVLTLVAIVILAGVGYGSYRLIHHHRQQVAAAKVKKAAAIKVINNPLVPTTGAKNLKAQSTVVLNDKSSTDAQRAQAYAARAQSEQATGQYAAPTPISRTPSRPMRVTPTRSATRSSSSATRQARTNRCSSRCCKLR
ncbi:MAG: hypothetical protein WDN27_04205 [Candidatus Saccharibacteria bacterium]